MTIRLMCAAVFAFAVMLGSAAPAAAGPCGAAAAANKIQRQIATLQTAQRRRQCSNSLFGGIFKGCGVIAQRKAGLQRQLASLSGSAKACARSRQAAKSRRAAKHSRREAATSRPRKPAEQAPQPTASSAARTYCVRMSDGYFFPAPNSQFAEDVEVDETLARCSFICEGANMAVYTLADIGGETDNMTSVKDGTPYSDLVSAFRYQTKSDLKSCDMNRFARHVLAGRRAKADAAFAKRFASRLADGQTLPRMAQVPIPRQRPQWSTSREVADNTATVRQADAGAPTRRPQRKIRIIGDPFLP